MTPPYAWPVPARRASTPSVTRATPRPLPRSTNCSPPHDRTCGAGHNRIEPQGSPGSLAVGLSLAGTVWRGPHLPAGAGTAAVQPPPADAGQDEQGGTHGD